MNAACFTRLCDARICARTRRLCAPRLAGFLVGAGGAVLETTLRKSSGDSSLDEAARTALAKCTFKPGTVDGKPTEQWTEVQYVWVSK